MTKARKRPRLIVPDTRWPKARFAHRHCREPFSYRGYREIQRLTRYANRGSVQIMILQLKEYFSDPEIYPDKPEIDGSITNAIHLLFMLLRTPKGPS